MVVLGAMMTLIAVAYTTFRAGTRSFEFTGMMDDNSETGYLALQDSDTERSTTITKQPKKKDPLRIQALQAAIAEGSLPASALEEEQDDDDEVLSNDTDDETIKVRYHYSSFHFIFVLATMYVAMLLTHWYVTPILVSIHYAPAVILMCLRFQEHCDPCSWRSSTRWASDAGQNW